MIELQEVIGSITATRRPGSGQRAILVAVSGIDGSGKSHVARTLSDGLRQEGYRVAEINIDGWLNLPRVRFCPTRPAEHFYRSAIHFNDMFSRLILPLRDTRRADVEVDHADAAALRYARRRYSFENVDVVIVEGNYLLRRAFRDHYDVSVWVHCSFETALERAITGAKVGRHGGATALACEQIYLPAQAIHLRIDQPAATANVVLWNDDRLAVGAAA